MKIIVIDENYPNIDNLYGDVFVHVRVKEYLNKGLDVKVIAHFNSEKAIDYKYEGVDVLCPTSIIEINKILEDINPDAILIHFATLDIIKTVIFFHKHRKFLVWVHGFEALSFFRRRFNYDFTKVGSIINFLRYGKSNIRQLFWFRKLISFSNNSENLHFIFVSDWMRRVTTADCLLKVKNYSIIPNPIDTSLFQNSAMTVERLKNILMIRPFHSKKYGTDIVFKTLLLLEKFEIFKGLNFTIAGGGLTESPLYKKFADYPNFTMINHFLNHENIAKLHREHGVFLSLTRQDAQGVSMCEALSSGMIVISSNNTAIPEFIENKQTGYLTNNKPENVLNKILEIQQNFDEITVISEAASKFTGEKLEILHIVKREISEILKIIKKNENSIYNRHKT